MGALFAQQARLGDAQHGCVEVMRLMQQEEFQPLRKGHRTKRGVDSLPAELAVRQLAHPAKQPESRVLEPA